MKIYIKGGVTYIMRALGFKVVDDSVNKSTTTTEVTNVSIFMPIFSEKGEPGVYTMSSYKEAIDTFGHPDTVRYGRGYDILLEHLQNGGTATVLKISNPSF